MTTARRLVITGTLPEYITSGERIARLDGDIRKMTAEMKAKLTDKSAEHNVTGYTLDDDSWELANNGRVVVLSVVLRRPE